MTADPLTFLHATHAAAQAGAEAAAERAWSPHWEFDHFVKEIRDLNNGNTLANLYFPEIGEHVEANDPAAVLRRIKADRKILAEHRADDEGRCGRCADWDTVWFVGRVAHSGRPSPCATVRNLAEGWGWTEEGT